MGFRTSSNLSRPPARISGFFSIHFLATLLGNDLEEAELVSRTENNISMEPPEVIAVK